MDLKNFFFSIFENLSSAGLKNRKLDCSDLRVGKYCLHFCKAIEIFYVLQIHSQSKGWRGLKCDFDNQKIMDHLK